MAFVEPTWASPAKRPSISRKRAKKAKSTKKRIGATRMRRAVVGGVSRASAACRPKSATPVPASVKETKKMAKRKRSGKSKRRSPAQIAATKRMLAANKRRVPTPKKRGRKPLKASQRKPVEVKTTAAGGRTVAVRSGKRRRPLSAGAQRFVKSIKSQVRTGKGKSRTTRYSLSSKGKAGVIIRENPANQTKAIVSAAGGFILGLAGADFLDRYVATRKGDSTAVKTNDEATLAIHKKADGIRIFAQAAAAGGLSVGAFLLRKKSVVGTYLLAGMATGFAAKGITLIIKDYLMPKLLEPKAGETKLANRLQYGVAGPRGYLRPFLGKPMMIGPQAAGSVGKYGCTRVPVNPSDYRNDGRNSCRPWPFDMMGSGSSDCMDTANARPPITQEPQRPPVYREPQPSIERSPRDPEGTFLPRTPGTVDQDSGRPEGTSVPLESGVNRYNYDPQMQQVSPRQRSGLTQAAVEVDRSKFVIAPIGVNTGVKGPYRFPGR